MNKGKVLLVALALLVVVAGTAQAEMFVEGYLGGNFAGTTSDMASASYFPRGPNVVVENSTVNFPGHIDPAFIGGVKVGAWFERSGVLSGINFPAWMKYFGFWLDFCYHRLDFPRRGSGIPLWSPGGLVIHPVIDSSEGGAATLAFMFAARYGFFPDKEVPFGRLQAYAAVGPAIMWTWQQPTVTFDEPGYPTFKPDAVATTNLALAVEAGLRWMCLKNVSLDVSFKYRYTRSSYAYSQIVSGFPINLWLEPTYNLFSIQVGAAYHF